MCVCGCVGVCVCTMRRAKIVKYAHTLVSLITFENSAGTNACTHAISTQPTVSFSVKMPVFFGFAYVTHVVSEHVYAFRVGFA